jgi:predicted alpha-1,2-mannosidase
MVSRRRFIQGLGVMASPLPFLSNGAYAAAQPATSANFGRHVNVFVGTGGHGHTYPGPSMPFGMVQLSPDTNDFGWDSSSGYHEGDGSIMGFTHTHLSGTGIGDLLDILVMPMQGELLMEPGERGGPTGDYHSRYDGDATHAQSKQMAPLPDRPMGRGYRSRFDAASEQGRPGYYRVHLTDHDILAELTATQRAGMHRYTFNRNAPSYLMVDLAHGYRRDYAVPSVVSDGQLRLVGNDTLVGGRRVHQWGIGRYIYFALKLSRPFTGATFHSDGANLAAGSKEASGTRCKVALHLDNAHAAPLVVKVGISAVDMDGALRNLDAEIRDFNFDRVEREAAQVWERELSRIRFDSSSAPAMRTFYSALYHTMLAPTLFSDVDGRYRAMDLSVKRLAQGEHNFSTYSLWDTYRALHPLLTLYQPGRVPDLVNGLIRMAEESPEGPPVWPLQGVETGCMIGYHSASVVAEAAAKGFKGIDYKRAWPLFRKRAMDDDYRGLRWYRSAGFIPADREYESVSTTLEYAYDDWAVSRLADAVGEKGDAAALRNRSRNYRNLFDPKVTFMRPRAHNGSWLEPFHPSNNGASYRWRDFTESNSWQATFLIQHDLYAYMHLFGGEKAFEAKLDELFNTSPVQAADAPIDVAGLVGQYAHGNEPSHHIAYLYAYTGAHYKTQSRVRMLMDTMYSPERDGLAGNEDCGQMSAWYVLSALGLYAVDPVSANYVFGSPLLDRAEVELLDGRKLVIKAHNNSPDHVYVQSVTWNGKPHARSWISHAELASGGTLEFHMGREPNKSFGADLANRPPAFGTPATQQSTLPPAV